MPSVVQSHAELCYVQSLSWPGNRHRDSTESALQCSNNEGEIVVEWQYWRDLKFRSSVSRHSVCPILVLLSMSSFFLSSADLTLYRLPECRDPVMCFTARVVDLEWPRIPPGLVCRVTHMGYQATPSEMVLWLRDRYAAYALSFPKPNKFPHVL
jgi:hypothetical protein